MSVFRAICSYICPFRTEYMLYLISQSRRYLATNKYVWVIDLWNTNSASCRLDIRLEPSWMLDERLKKIHGSYWLESATQASGQGTLRPFIQSRATLYLSAVVTTECRGSFLELTGVYMRLWNGSLLVQVMACRLYGAKPLPASILTYFQLDAYFKWNFNQYKNIFIQKCTLQNVQVTLC